MFYSVALPPIFLLLLTGPGIVSANGRDQEPARPSDSTHDISNRGDVRYTAALSIGGSTINVILDTGSTDLWINPRTAIGPFDSTGVAKKISYADGSVYINGTIGLAEVTVAGHTIPRQAFINVTEIAGLDACGSGICGLVGLGFDSPTAGIEKSLSDAGLDGPTLGKSVLSSIFDANPDKGRFFGMSLSRLGDSKDTADASLSISEYDAKYSEVQWMAKRPVFPETAKSWHILADGVSVNGLSIPWTANSQDTPSGKTLIGLDTGTTNIIVRPEIRDRIYSAVPGAVLAKNSSLGNAGHWSSDRDVWVVPCNTPVSFSVIFGGQPYPLHPLDLTTLHTQVGPDNVTYTICVGSITNGGSITTGKTDALFGDSFLRNVYTVFSFGDNTTSPYIQFLSQTNEWEATQDFAHVRQSLLATHPPEIAPADLIRLFDGHSWSSSSDTPSGAGDRLAANLAAGSASSDTDTDSIVAKYGAIIIGLLAANLVFLLVLLGVGVLTFVRNGRQTGISRIGGTRYIPVKDGALLPPPFAEGKSYSDD